MVHFDKRRFFPERRRRQTLRWVLWAMMALLFLVLVVFMKLFR
jgi:cell division septal protein FtsQ